MRALSLEYNKKPIFEVISFKNYKKILHVVSSRVESGPKNIAINMMRSLDEDVLKLARGLHLTDTNHIQYLSGGAINHISINTLGQSFSEWPSAKDEVDIDLNIDVEKKQVRHQALKAFPIFSHVMVNDIEIIKTIDERRELLPALAGHFKTDLGNIKKLQGLTWQKAGRRPSDRNFDMLFNFQKDQMPRKRSEFMALNNMERSIRMRSSTVSYLSQLFLEKPRQTLDTLRGSDPQDIIDFLRDYKERFLKIMALQVFYEKYDDLVDLKEREFTKSLMRLQKNKNSEFTLSQALQASERWHNSLARIEESLSYSLHQTPKNRDNGWIPLIGDIQLKGGMSFEEMHSVSRFQLQGLMENHCVAGYSKYVVSPKSTDNKNIFTFIGSIHKEGKVLSTAEVHVSFAGDDFDLKKPRAEIVQNRAHSNGPAPKEVLDIEADICAAFRKVTSQEFTDYRDSLKDWKKENWQSVAGYNLNLKDRLRFRDDLNIDDPDLAKKAWDVYAPLLPGRIRKKGFEAFLSDIRSVILEPPQENSAEKTYMSNLPFEGPF
jgi:hypothetical protein